MLDFALLLVSETVDGLAVLSVVVELVGEGEIVEPFDFGDETSFGIFGRFGFFI